MIFCCGSAPTPSSLLSLSSPKRLCKGGLHAWHGIDNILKTEHMRQGQHQQSWQRFGRAPEQQSSDATSPLEKLEKQRCRFPGQMSRRVVHVWGAHTQTHPHVSRLFRSRALSFATVVCLARNALPLPLAHWATFPHSTAAAGKTQLAAFEISISW